ncbi:Vitamin B6 transporter TPN1 [Cyphellophora attinorum]|uniref:Vitamin B6 transporter TPN1 n=1 Tax=Cyphellophora attinorum TaxID=1664694 RepID=A0A0N1H3W8_9EURO|nr:Vitamin B6 transporter TPN1 [Phialophora attinorum]KPI36510.1 Vitamin B6 transporter TPN1 [Phialophora attinorum]
MSTKPDQEAAVDMNEVKEDHIGYVEPTTPAVSDMRDGELGAAAKPLPKSLQKLQHAELWLNNKLGIEQQGIELLRESDKRPPSLWNAFLIWSSLNVHFGQVPIGLVGAEFGLSLGWNLAAIIGGIAAGALLSAFCATLGPKLGLRQIVSSRFSFGIWGARLCAVLNVIVLGGFSIIGSIVTGGILDAVSNYTIGIELGIILVAILAYVVSFFGFRVIHQVEKYYWIFTAILMFVLIGQSASYVDASIPTYGTDSLAIAGTFLTIFAVNASVGVGWSTMASDYMIHYHASTPSWKIYFINYAGIVVFTSFPTIVGALIGNIAFANPNSSFAAAYASHGIGGLLLELYHPVGWAKTAMVLLSFSTVAGGAALSYSSGLSLQLLSSYSRAVPRFIWSFLWVLVTTIIAVAGRNDLSSFVTSLISIVGYWIVPFAVILLLEDQVFRRRRGYVVDDWNTPSRLPWGVAAVFALLAGYLCGGLPGMAQTWFVGPVAAYFGPYGGDVGLYMSAAISAVVYLAARPIEMHYAGR